MGYSEDTAKEIVELFAEVDWQRQFETGKSGPENPLNYKTGQKYSKGLLASMAKTGAKGDGGKLKVNSDSEMLSPVSFPKQDASWGQPPSRQLNGMRQL
jgi:hypothetical protein